MYPKSEKQANSSCRWPKADIGHTGSSGEDSTWTAYSFSTFSPIARGEGAFRQKNRQDHPAAKNCLTKDRVASIFADAVPKWRNW